MKKGPFKMKGMSFKSSPVKGFTGFMASQSGKKSKTPKLDKFADKALEHVANVATAGLYGRAKKYVKKQGGLAATLDKHLPVGNKTKKVKKAAKTYGVLKSDKNKKQAAVDKIMVRKKGRVMESMKKVAKPVEKKYTKVKKDLKMKPPYKKPVGPRSK
tara:strand:- start:222 stop:695 length:474 start_codon:yes stop_codon:yes gene_type:complete